MNEKIEKTKAWVKKNWLSLLGLGLAGGGLVYLGLSRGKHWDVKLTKADEDPITGFWTTSIPTAMRHKPLSDKITHIDPWVRLIPSKWNAGTLHSLDWSEDDALICIENITADKLGVLGEDLLGCAMKEGEPVDALIHIFYDVSDNSQK